MMLIGALLETGSVALVLSVVSVLIAPDGIDTNLFLRVAYDLGGFTDRTAFTVFMMFMICYVSMLSMFVIIILFLHT